MNKLNKQNRDRLIEGSVTDGCGVGVRGWGGGDPAKKKKDSWMWTTVW